MIYQLTDKNFYLNHTPMAKMIKHKDSFVSVNTFLTMLRKVERISKISDTSSLVYMDDRNKEKIEVKAPWSMEKVIECVDNEDYEGEIAAHLFSYYIGEI